ncbi:DEAD/DEAH box helicase [Klugiella xanthotipulae]|uniref:Superfamily II RNA helicase n=1 Tax=Klugiella xanthotipulae TaxID=244735 RepID=A0A543HTE3_9MICO|nr:DEAD/DEAH box helicase [Klugiella xanthotipulae]TQM61529.1 superfamily II RNA helicase [Klugiella xanthotipulae]
MSNSTPLQSLITSLRADGADPDATFEAFTEWAQSTGISLYPAQEEALMEIVSGSNVILSTPTGTGKSLVAMGAHFAALVTGERSYYTAPIKALVSEKFFALVAAFGADNVGMVTGDSSVNSEAPIICCTAEILANEALRYGDEANVGQVVMDEFHYYADPDRGWAWQVPLLMMPHTQFILMSATLGDVTELSADLTRRTKRPTAEVTGSTRPVPLAYDYATTPVQETIEELMHADRAPIYVVHFAQAAAAERAQSLTSLKLISREQRDEIAEAIGEFKFTTGFGKTLSRLVRSGIGVHHAGMLPRYRRLVEQLAQRGLMRVICGTDTLGVGINVPIRTVLLSGLTKYDGVKMRQLNAREFHQIAGRAGRAGYDTAGDVVLQAPEHEIDNLKMIQKAGDDPKKKRKIIRKKAPQGFVSWGEASFERIIHAQPETLMSTMTITHSMILNVIGHGREAFERVRALVFDNHESPTRQFELARRAIAIYRTLRAAGIVEQYRDADGAMQFRLTVDLQANFALNQPLSPFAIAALELLDEEEATYPLDVISVIESTLEDPRPIIGAQQFIARGEAVNAMKAEGIEYDERMELLDAVTHPQPLSELLAAAFELYAAERPWARDFELRPKAVVRDMYERAMTFTEYVSFYKIARSEGLVLRYLSDAYRAISQTVPDEKKNDELRDIIEWLGELVRQVDSSLLDEWEELAHPDPEKHAADSVALPPPPRNILSNRRAFLVLVRNEMFRRVQHAAYDRFAELGELDAASGFDADAWADALDEYYEEYDTLGSGPDARGPQMLVIDESAAESERVWRVRQIFDDPAGDHDWGIRAEVDLAESVEAGEAVVRVTGVGMF